MKKRGGTPFYPRAPGNQRDFRDISFPDKVYHLSKNGVLKAGDLPLLCGNVFKPVGLWYTREKFGWVDHAKGAMKRCFYDDNKELQNWYLHTIVFKDKVSPFISFGDALAVLNEDSFKNSYKKYSESADISKVFESQLGKRILCIASEAEFATLCDTYIHPLYDSENAQSIELDYQKLEDHFAGIDISFDCDDNFGYANRYKHVTLGMWDICSGCIWNAEILDFNNIVSEPVDLQLSQTYDDSDDDTSYDSDDDTSYDSDDDTSYDSDDDTSNDSEYDTSSDSKNDTSNDSEYDDGDDSRKKTGTSGQSGGGANQRAVFAGTAVSLLIVIASSIAGSVYR